MKRPLQFGRIVHEMIEKHANQEDPFSVLDNFSLDDRKYFQAERDMYGDILQDVRYIMEAYFNFWKNEEIVYLRHNRKSSEHEFAIEIGDGLMFKGKIDGRGISRKLRWLVEHKSFSRMPSDDHRWRNLQSAVYIRANDMLGWKPLDGTLWDYIYSKPPVKPEILKNGRMSTKKIVSLPNVVREVLAENNLKKKDYTEFFNSIIDGQSTYFSRIYNPVTSNVVDYLFQDFLSTARELSDLHGKSQTRTIDRHCDWCDYEPICRAEITNSDVDYIIEKEYDRELEEEPVTDNEEEDK